MKKQIQGRHGKNCLSGKSCYDDIERFSALCLELSFFFVFFSSSRLSQAVRLMLLMMMKNY